MTINLVVLSFQGFLLICLLNVDMLSRDYMFNHAEYQSFLNQADENDTDKAIWLPGLTVNLEDAICHLRDRYQITRDSRLKYAS